MLVLHPEEGQAATPDAGETGYDGNSSTHDGGDREVGAGAAASNSGSSGGGRADERAAALKMQTVMALSAQLMGRKAAVVVQVGG